MCRKNRIDHKKSTQLTSAFFRKVIGKVKSRCRLKLAPLQQPLQLLLLFVLKQVTRSAILLCYA